MISIHLSHEMVIPLIQGDELPGAACGISEVPGS
jgi:hypothetical protein